MLQNEQDKRIAGIWERHLDMEIGQLHAACDLLRRYEGIEPDELLPAELPDTPVTFEPNKEYVREVLATQVDLRADGLQYAPADELPSDHRYFEIQRIVNRHGAPSEMVIEDNREQSGGEYRDETEGDHPVMDLREPARAER
jgi:hypothetical protein